MFASPSLNRRDDLLSRPSPFVVMTARKSRPHSNHGSAPARTRHQAHNFNFGAVPRWLANLGVGAKFDSQSPKKYTVRSAVQGGLVRPGTAAAVSVTDPPYSEMS
jgi:hypothetical protein